MISDLNKGITDITYNHLNLPTKVSFGLSDVIEYVYDAAGVKLEKKVSIAGAGYISINGTLYGNNFIYDYIDGNGGPPGGNTQSRVETFKFIFHPEGYAEPSTNSYKYIYQYKDHLGNVRLSYSDADGNGTVSQSEIIEESNYYPFGGSHKGYNNVVNGVHHPYGYSGKEEQDELGLQWMDFGARNYDKWLGRWMNIDPMAEKMYSQSTYNYAFNNPMLFVDPDGMFPIIIHVRSFVPTKRFVLNNQFAGDDRGFSSNVSARSRLHQRTSYETDTGVSSHTAQGTFSYSNYGAYGYSKAYVDDMHKNSRYPHTNQGRVLTHLYGSNAALLVGPHGQPINSSAITPDIDIHSRLSVDVSQLDGGNQLLNISGNIRGDAFPSAEAFVEDAKGNTVFLGAFATPTSVKTGMFTKLPGNNSRHMMMNINLSIITDSDGIFTGIKAGDKTISIDDWNKNFESMSVEQFKEKYGDYYNQLFGNKK